MCEYVCLCVCDYVYIMYMYLCVYVRVCLYAHMSMCECAYVTVHVCASMSSCDCVYVGICVGYSSFLFSWSWSVGEGKAVTQNYSINPARAKQLCLLLWQTLPLP